MEIIFKLRELHKQLRLLPRWINGELWVQNLQQI